MDSWKVTVSVVGFLLVAGAVLLPRIMWRRSQRRQPRPRPENFAFVPTPEEERRLNEARDVLVQVDSFASAAFARLDTRMRFLNRLIEDADVRIKALEREAALRRAEADRG